jgi:hypothetical protein
MLKFSGQSAVDGTGQFLADAGMNVPGQIGGGRVPMPLDHTFTFFSAFIDQSIGSGPRTVFVVFVVNGVDVASLAFSAPYVALTIISGAFVGPALQGQKIAVRVTSAGGWLVPPGVSASVS